MLSIWEIAALVVAAWFLVRVTRGRHCGRKRGFARVALVVGAIVLGWLVLRGYRHDQRGAVMVQNLPARRDGQRTVRFGSAPPNSDFARIDADDLKQYRAQVSRRARLSSASDVEASEPEPVLPASKEAKSPPPMPALPAEQPETPASEAPLSAPAVPAPPATPAVPAPSAPAATPAPTKSAKKVKVQFQAGPLRVEMDTDEESGLPSSEELTRAATSVAAQATVEGVKYLTRATADAAKKTAARFASTSKKAVVEPAAAKKKNSPAKNTTAKQTTATTATTPEAVPATAAAGSYSTSSGVSSSAGNPSYVAQSTSTSSSSSLESSHPTPMSTVDSADLQAARLAAQRPAWVDQPLGKQGSVYRTRVAVGPYKTRQECDREIVKEALQAARSVIDRQVGGSNQISDRSLQPYLFSPRILKEEWEEHKESDTAAVGEMIYLHALLEFDERSWRELARMQHEREITRRLEEVGVGASLLLALLGTAFGYLKLDTMTRGYYTRRLQLAAGAVILGIAVVVVRLIR